MTKEKENFFGRYRWTILAAVFCLLAVAVNTRMSYLKAGCTVEATGEVVSVKDSTKEQKNGGTVLRYKPVAAYYAGEAYYEETVAGEWQYTNVWAPGQEIELLYNPDHPKTVILSQDRSLYVKTAGQQAGEILLYVVACVIFSGAGFLMDRSRNKGKARHREKEIEAENQIGKEAYQKKQAEEEKAQQIFRKENCAALLLAAAGTILFAAVQKWMAGEMSKPLAAAAIMFFFTYYIFFLWLISLRRKRFIVIELFFIIPWLFLPFFLALPASKTREKACGIISILAAELLVFAIGYCVQRKRQTKDCTVFATARVVGNVKSAVRSRKGRSSSVSSYQPVLQYDVKGVLKEVVYPNGLPRPMEVGTNADILYNPKEPEELRLANEEKDITERIVVPLFIGLAVIFLGLAAFLWIYR